MEGPTPLALLHRVFGFQQFRGRQQEIIEHLTGGGDALVLMPTGSGKSLCYQIPALLRDGVGLVVSPLIALMQDQVAALRQLGLRVAFCNSTLHAAEARAVEQAMVEGALDLLYVAPERLMTERFLGLLDRTRLALVAIDEAHCVSQWGHDFRPEYLRLAELARRFPRVPRIAVTATADHTTREEIAEKLALDGARRFIAGFDRPNISYQVHPKRGAFEQLAAFLRREHPEQSGIVYCMTRKKVEETAKKLRAAGWRAAPYHAGLDGELRRRTQDRFITGEGLVIVATVAFGMGIDKPDVRFVAHLDLPKSLEAYYQETGRAGRDGQPASAWMAYGLADVIALRQLASGSTAGERHKRHERERLEALLGYCETTGCRRQALLRYFGEEAPESCGNCDTCWSPVESWDGTVAAQKALSCVYRTGQRFGAAHVIDVLLGRDNQRAGRLGHERLSTWGIGAELSVRQWRGVFRQLVAAGALTVDEHGGLVLSGAGVELLRGERAIRFRRDDDRPRQRTRRRAAAEPPAGEVDPALWEALRALRSELAGAQNLPPYVIFHDRTLREMAARRPATAAELASIHGVGSAKLERYGAQFLELLARHATR